MDGRGRASALSLALGLATTAGAGLAFLALTGRALPAREAAALASLYLLVNTVGPGVFIALEQEVSRSVSAASALGGALVPVVRRARRLALGLLGATAAAVLVAGPLLLDRNLGGRVPLLLLLLVSLLGAAAAHVVRGLLAGVGDFRAFGASVGAEGLARLLPTLAVLAWAGPGIAVVLFGAAYACGQLVSAGVGAVALLGARLEDGDPLVPGPRLRPVLALLVVSAATQLVQNVVPLVVTARLVDDPARALAFAQAFLLSRAPLLLLAPVQAVLLPAFSRAVAVADLAGARRLLRLVLLLVAALGAAGGAAYVLAAPVLLRLSGSPQDPGTGVLVVLAFGTALMAAVNSLQPALVALGRQAASARAFTACVAVMAAVLVLPVDPVTAALVATLLGPGVVLTAQAAVLVRDLGPRTPSVDA